MVAGRRRHHEVVDATAQRIGDPRLRLDATTQDGDALARFGLSGGDVEGQVPAGQACGHVAAQPEVGTMRLGLDLEVDSPHRTALDGRPPFPAGGVNLCST